MAEIPKAPLQDSWESLLEKIIELGEDIIEKTLEDNIVINRIAVVPRGGLHVTNILARMLALRSHQVINLGLTRYGLEDSTQAGEFEIGQMPTRELVDGQTVLLPDEVQDSGETMRLARNTLYNLGAKCVMTAVVHYKPAMNITGLVPDFYKVKTDDWVQYPWDDIDKIGSDYRQAMEDRNNGHHVPAEVAEAL